MTKRERIPPISDEELEKLAERIKPVVLREGRLFYIWPCDLRDIAFTWDPKPSVMAMNIRPLRDITTYHTFGAPSLFKPSIAEVIAQIPTNLLDEVVAFECNVGGGDLDRRAVADDYHHKVTTRLYARAS